MKTFYIILLTLITKSFLISGSPIIVADDWNFGTYNIIAPTPMVKTIRIENKSTTDDLIITGASRLTLPVFTAVFDFISIKRLSDITPQNPLRIKSNSYIEFMIYCKPTTTGLFRDSIVFTSNATSIDSVTYINVEGVKDSIIINDFDWGDHEVTTPKFPIRPKLGANETDTALTFYNPGKNEITIEFLDYKIIKGEVKAFLLEDFSLLTSFNVINPILRLPAGKKVVKNIYFSPTKLGEHEIEVTFLINSYSSQTVVLKGNGVKSAASIQENYDDKISISNKENSIFISSQTDAQLTYKLISLTGTQISSGNLETTTEILLNNLPKQILLLEILNSLEQVILRKKVIMEWGQLNENGVESIQPHLLQLIIRFN